LTDFKYEVNMKARQLSLFKAEAKTSVSSTCCGTALTYLKNEANMKARQLLFFKARQNKLSVAPAVGPF
jgi:hypothetical protein